MPSDDELVVAIVGVGGTWAERLDATRIARELLVPNRPSGIDELQIWHEWHKEHFEEAVQSGTVDAFARIGLLDEAEAIYHAALPLAAARVQQELWPDESFDQLWDVDGSRDDEWLEVSRLDPAQRWFKAIELEHRLSRLAVEFTERLPTAFAEGGVPYGDQEMRRQVTMARNVVMVALTGDHENTCEPITTVLRSRGLYSMRVDHYDF